MYKFRVTLNSAVQPFFVEAYRMDVLNTGALAFWDAQQKLLRAYRDWLSCEKVEPGDADQVNGPVA